MSHVLVWKRVFPGSEYDIFTPTNYEQLYQHVMVDWNGKGQNWGNKLWFQGVYSAINTGENTYDFLADDIQIDRINSDYDFIILPMANIFHTEFIPSMRILTEIFEKIRIPIYVVVCGVQAASYDDLDKLISEIGADSKKFIRSIYNTGGEFALRGYFTQEFFHKLGFHSAVVTGCPSLYQFGPDFHVDTAKQSSKLLRPMFNGFVRQYKDLFKRYPQSIFLDQSEYFRPLYQPDYLSNANLMFEMNFVSSYGAYAAHLLAEGRIAMIADMNDWSHYLKISGFNYSFGSRIHGTIMALLSGIPATIITTDSRTREMAEFFDIPHIVASNLHCFSHEEFLALYQSMDYVQFNRSFRDKFNLYEQFLVSHGIVSHVNTENHFMDAPNNADFLLAMEAKKAEFTDFAEKLDRDRHLIAAGNLLRKIKGKVF